MKKITVLAVLMLCLSASAWAASKRDFTLIVSPARYTAIQVMFDVIKQRDAVLLSYQGEAATENPLLHYWNGSAWISLDLHDLNELRFLNSTPSRAVLVGDDSLLPASVKDSLAWLPEKSTVTAMDHAGLLNQLDSVFHWTSREWSWFAKRYNLNLQDENKEQRSRSWYDRSGPLKGPDATSAAPAPAPVGKIDELPAPVAVDAAPVVASPEPAAAVPDAPAAPEPMPAVGQQDDLEEVIEMLERAKTEEAVPQSFPVK